MPKRAHTKRFVTMHGVPVTYEVWPDGQGVTLVFEPFLETIKFDLNAADLGEMCSLLNGAVEAALRQSLAHQRAELEVQLRAQLEAERDDKR